MNATELAAALQEFDSGLIEAGLKQMSWRVEALNLARQKLTDSIGYVQCKNMRGRECYLDRKPCWIFYDKPCGVFGRAK